MHIEFSPAGEIRIVLGQLLSLYSSVQPDKNSKKLDTLREQFGHLFDDCRQIAQEEPLPRIELVQRFRETWRSFFTLAIDLENLVSEISPNQFEDQDMASQLIDFLLFVSKGIRERYKKVKEEFPLK